ncbi:hypothetical protein CQW23_31879 [Capsicum baccatum]|uniref:F-box domain-containing protein n=1 Tax=Capsicum baccatum TaxID=33114 RepID=A0A2G2V6B7_CAPBA|nr:hypothetical protein CQW23_31879 [Capsicum baccatum]
MDYVSQISDVDKAKVDYMSQLLDDVLSSILSRMTIKDAVKTSILSTRWRYLGSGMMAEDNTNELESPVTSVKNDSMAEDNTDELVSPVTSMKNDSMDEDNIDELVSPVTSVKNDSAGSKPDKISTIKPRSMSNGNKVLPYSSTTSSYNAGNIRRQSTVKLNSPDSRQDVIPHYVRASTGYFHDFCKYGRKYSSEAKTWHPLSKRKIKLPADEQSPARTLVGEGKKGTLVKQKLYTPSRSCMERGIDEVTTVEQKSSASLEKKLNEIDRRPSPKVYSLEPSEIRKKKILLTPKSVHSLKLDSSSHKMPETEKKMKSSFKILGGVDEGGKKDNVADYRKQIIVPKVSAEKYLKTPTLSSPPKSSSVKPFILRVRSNKSLKLLAPPKDQNKMRRDGTNKLNLEMVPEKNLHTPKVKASPKS